MPKIFEAQIGSTVNRLQRFIRNQTMRSMFGQPDVSLDLGRALEEGSIIIVSPRKRSGRKSRKRTPSFSPPSF
ncbi:MAG: hypothetical protein WDM76_07865 [Limisphaerales bacterium]